MRVLDLSGGGIEPATVRMPDGKEYPLRLVRAHAASAALEDRMLRLSQLWEDAPAGGENAGPEDRVERHRLLEEAAIEIIDCPPDLVRRLHPVGQTRVVQLYFELQREALDPTATSGASSSAAPSSSPPSTDSSAADSPSGSEPAPA